MKVFRVLLWLIVLFAILWQDEQICELNYELDVLKRHHYYCNTLDALYWKPKINSVADDTDRDSYYKSQQMAAGSWYPDGWQSAHRRGIFSYARWQLFRWGIWQS